MGKGDIKTKKGKRAAGSYGVTRPRKVEKKNELGTNRIISYGCVYCANDC